MRIRSTAHFLLGGLLTVSLLYFSSVLNAAETKDETRAWRPPAIDYDWLQLTSSEWLKGEINSLYSKVLEFDSEKLGLLQIKLGDIKFLQSHSNSIAYIEGVGTVKGKLQLTQDKIIMVNGDETRAFDRSRLVSFITGEQTERNFWSAKISVGVNLQRGNTQQTDFNTLANVKRRTSRSRIVFDYLGNISSSGGVETVNNHRASATYDRFKTRRFFYRPVFVEYFRDPFQNISRKLTLGTGLGYTLIDNAMTEWNVSGGPAYQSTRFVTVEADRDIEESTPVLVLGTQYDTELSSQLDLKFRYDVKAGNAKSGGYTHHAIATFEFELNESLDIDVSFVWDRISKPTAADDGITPEPDDYQLLLSIGYSF